MKWNAELYAGQHSFVHELGEPVIELLDPKPGERILDLGCGSGELTKKLAESSADVTGIDSSAEMIEKAKKNFPELDPRVMDAQSLDIPDEKFDGVFSNAAFHWFSDPARSAKEVFRVLRKGGRLAMEF